MLPVLRALALLAVAQAQTWVEVDSGSEGEVEKRYTPELVQELQTAKEDALILYTEYTATSGGELKGFLRSIAGYANETLRRVDAEVLDRAPQRCRDPFVKLLQKIQYDAHRAASFSAENHHKFFLGHMIVFRMHLNKSEELVKRCDMAVRTCGIPCETTPKVSRWRRQALQELHRVRDDMLHSRKSYKDLLTHYRRKLKSLRRHADGRARDALAALADCARRS